MFTCTSCASHQRLMTGVLPPGSNQTRLTNPLLPRRSCRARLQEHNKRRRKLGLSLSTVKRKVKGPQMKRGMLPCTAVDAEAAGSLLVSSGNLQAAAKRSDDEHRAAAAARVSDCMQFCHNWPSAYGVQLPVEQTDHTAVDSQVWQAGTYPRSSQQGSLLYTYTVGCSTLRCPIVDCLCCSWSLAEVCHNSSYAVQINSLCCLHHAHM